jgi:restriction endonuclease Mrr
MSVPDFQSFMLPLLKVCADGQEHPTQSLKKPVHIVLLEFQQAFQRLLRDLKAEEAK